MRRSPAPHRSATTYPSRPTISASAMNWQPSISEILSIRTPSQDLQTAATLQSRT